MTTPTDTEVTERAPDPPDPAPSVLSPLGLGRWAWRQLTSMRTALVLLLLLALAAVPGSVVPQAAVASGEVARWKADHPDLAPVYDALGLFSVYDSVWFSAIYLLLMASLVGCIVPRSRVYLRSVRAAPPPAPRHLSRLPAYETATSPAAPGEVLAQARAVLGRRRRYRLADTASGTVSAERGHAREAGNLLFHISVVVVLVGFAAGQLFGYKGGAIVLVGGGFANSLTQYDDFAPGSFFDPADLPPVSLTVEDFEAEFVETGPQRGQPIDFGADVTYQQRPGAPTERHRLQVNEPLMLDGLSVFLVGHGYAPVLTVRDGSGRVAYSGPVVFLPQDASFASFGVLKVPQAEPDQLGLEGMFYPTYAFVNGDPVTLFPDARNPTISMLAYRGDLGLDDGTPQSVFELDTDRMDPIEKPDGKPFRLDLQPGQTARLPDGAGSVTFDRWQRWVKLQASDTPGKGVALTGVVLALVGLMGSLFVRRRRIWVRVSAADGGSYVEVAGLDRHGRTEGLAEEVRDLTRRLVPTDDGDTGTTGDQGTEGR